MEKVKNFLFGIAVVGMFSFIGWGPGVQMLQKYEPNQRTVTNEAYFQKEREAAHYKAELKFADQIIMDIIRASR